MAQSSHPGHFFQTSTALSESARKAQKAKNTAGNPTKLSSKILAAVADPSSPNHVFVAEAAGRVRRVALDTHEISQMYAGPTAPLTSLAVAVKSGTLLAGCWDKSIWAWPLSPSPETGPRPRRFTGGHTDFIKSLLVTSLSGTEILFSGGADATICAWDIGTGALLYKLQGHRRGVLSLALDPGSYVGAMARQAASAVLWSAGSEREIRAWRVGRDGGRGVEPGDTAAAEGEEGEEAGVEGGKGNGKEEVGALVVHETSVDALFFDSEGDLWTASADRTAKCLSRARGWAEDTSLLHPDYVRAVVVDEVGGLVVTACRDEHVRVWEQGSGRLVHVFEGHYEEVTALVLVEERQLVVSVSIDGTVREWSLKKGDLEKAVMEKEREEKGEVVEEEKKEGVMTEEEERELAELMEEED